MEKNDILRKIIGNQYTILEKINVAHEVYKLYGGILFNDSRLNSLLFSYNDLCLKLQSVSNYTGMSEICSDCAQNHGGSCCGEGIEDWFDTTLILINILLGSFIPLNRLIPKGCLFLGNNGCLIKAKHTICVNYLCKRLQNEISSENLILFQDIMIKYTENLFFIEERIKKIFIERARNNQKL